MEEDLVEVMMEKKVIVEEKNDNKKGMPIIPDHSEEEKPETATPTNDTMINLKKRKIHYILFKMILWCIGYFVVYFVVMMFTMKANKIFAISTGIGALLVFLVTIHVVLLIVIGKVELFVINGSSDNNTLPRPPMEQNGRRNIFIDEEVIESLAWFCVLPCIFFFLHSFIMYWSIGNKMELKDDRMLIYVVVILSVFSAYHLAYYISRINRVMESIQIKQR